MPSPTTSRATDKAEVPITDAPQLGAKDFRSKPPGGGSEEVCVLGAGFWVTIMLLGSSGTAQSIYPPGYPVPRPTHTRHRVRGVRVMTHGDPLLPGHGVPGGAPGAGSAIGFPVAGEMAHMNRSTWR